MEACASNLKEFVSGNYNGPLLHTSKIDILKQLASGLDFLHGHIIFHHDLKPSTVLISHAIRTPQIKLSNFAFVRVCQSRDLPLCKTAGTNKAWMAPEVYELAEVALSMNIFTLGLLFAFFLSGGLHPFADEKEERASNIKQKKPIILTVEQLKNIVGAEEIFNLIRSMLKFEVSERPTALEVLKHSALNPASAVIEQRIITETPLRQIVGMQSQQERSGGVADGPQTSVDFPSLVSAVENIASASNSQELLSTAPASEDNLTAGPSSALNDSPVLQPNQQRAQETETNQEQRTNKRRTERSDGAAAKAMKLETLGKHQFE